MKEFVFYAYEKYGTTIQGVINADGIVMLHKQDESYDYKNTDVLHVQRDFDKLLLRPNGKVHVSVQQLDKVKDAFIVALKLLKCEFCEDVVDDKELMKTLYTKGLYEEEQARIKALKEAEHARIMSM